MSSIAPRVIKALLNSSNNAIHTATGNGQWVAIPPLEKMNIEAVLSAAGGSATIEVHGSNFGGVPSEGSRLATFILSGADDRASETKTDPGYFYMCTKVTAISGGASVNVVVGG